MAPILALKAILLIKTVTAAELATTEIRPMQPLANPGKWCLCVGCAVLATSH